MNISGALLSALIPVWTVVQPVQSLDVAPTGPSHLAKAGEVIGMVVVDSKNQKVGKVDDLAVDLEAGRVAEVLVDTGGRLTSKQRIVAVPPQSFIQMGTNNELRMSADVEAFDSAPEFNVSAWNDFTSKASVVDVYERFHVRPYLQVGPLKAASALDGAVTRNAANDRLGKVDFLVVDLPKGTLPEIVVVTGGFLGRKGELTAIPPQGFTVGSDSDSLILDTSKQALKAAPHFKNEDWKSAITSAMAAASAAGSVQTIGSLNDSKGDSTNAVETPADVVITEKIQTKIMAADGLSDDARKVHVIAREGRVTLRGVADSISEKKQLGDIAATVVPADHVDNQVEVKMFAIASGH